MVNMNTILDIRKAADYLGKHVKTLQKWDRSGKLVPTRTGTNRRVYTLTQLNAFLGQQKLIPQPQRSIAYLRVSSQAQRPDLKNQRKVLEEFCVNKGLSGVEFVEEVGGGLNFKRPKFITLMDAVGNKEVKTLIIAHKDRLCRFGFEWFESFCGKHGCELLLLNQERLSPEQEMVQDLLAIVHCFSSRLYGLRNYRKSLKEALKNDSST